MNTDMKRLMSETIREFRLPRYRELPDMGLYLEQTVKYLNTVLSPLGCLEMTASMVSNYVKKGIIAKPVKKQYYAEHIAYLLFMVFAKNLVSIEDIGLLMDIQRGSYSLPVAYDYFCLEVENCLCYLFGVSNDMQQLGTTISEEKDLFRNLIYASSQVIYMTACFNAIRREKQEEAQS